MKAFLTAAVLAALPVVAPAATVNVTGSGAYNAVDSIVPGGSATLNVLVSTPTSLQFAFAGTGKAADLADITWKVNGTGPEYTWTSIVSFGNIASATGTVNGVTSGSDFFVEFYDGISNTVGLSFSVFAYELPTPTPVPVPAAGLLAGAGVVALGALKARRKA